MDLNPDEASRKKTAAQFAQTEGFKQKYGYSPGMANHFLSILQQAQMNDQGEFGIYGWGGRDKATFTTLKSFGGEFASLGSDYAAWIGQMTKTNDEYAKYTDLVKAAPGRDSTILGAQFDQQPNTLLGSNRSTVLG